jgi:hypothetical protein
MFFGLPDPDLLVRGTDSDPAPDPSLSHKGVTMLTQNCSKILNI